MQEERERMETAAEEDGRLKALELTKPDTSNAEAERERMHKDPRPLQWQEGEYTVTRSHRYTSPGCHNSCGILYYTKNGIVEKVEGDPESPIFNGRLCPRCLQLADYINHERRLKYPMRRVGERGEDKWERITWDEALDEIAEKTLYYKKTFGPASICVLQGTGRAVCAINVKMKNSVFQTPNLVWGFLSGEACMMPRVTGSTFLNGDFTIFDAGQLHEDRFDNPEYEIPECVLMWGTNPIVSNPDGFMGHWIVDLMKLGTELIVVDPRVTWAASRAKYHLALRPGSDGALALGFLNVIINEGLYDADFVEKWTFGFEELKERVQEYPPEEVEKITWVPAEKIRAAARFYATSKPAGLQWGLALDSAPHGVSAAHAINCMVAICGNLDVPGGNVIVREAYNAPIASLGNWGGEDLDQEYSMQNKFGAREYPMYMMGMDAQCDTHLKFLEGQEMEYDYDYPVKMYWIAGCNPLSNMGNEVKRVYNAIKNYGIEFVVVVDSVMTATAEAFADIVLPAASTAEYETIRAWWWPMRACAKVTQIGESRSDLQILLDMGKRIRPEAFPYENVEEMLDEALEGAGVSYQELLEGGYIYPDFEYRRYEKGLLRDDGSVGFNTPSGRIDLYSSLFANWGLDPLPYFKEPYESPYSTPELMEEYPLVLTTGARSWVYFHSESRHQDLAREIHPWPQIQIHPDTAKKYGIEHGDWVWIENSRGRVKQKANVTPIIDPRVVHADHGWSYPEKDGAEPSLFGTFESNINVLTKMGENGPMGCGSNTKCTICKIYKAEEGVA